LKYKVPLAVTQGDPSAAAELMGSARRIGADHDVAEVRSTIQMSMPDEGGRFEAKNILFPSGENTDSQLMYRSFENGATVGVLHPPFVSLENRMLPLVQAGLTTLKNKVLPSGENAGYVSNLVSRDTVPGANTTGCSPGGFWPTWALSASVAKRWDMATGSQGSVWRFMPRVSLLLACRYPNPRQAPADTEPYFTDGLR
jgi:hypothetical protein